MEIPPAPPSPVASALDPLPADAEERLDAAAGALQARGWASWPAFLPEDEVAGLRGELAGLLARGAFRPAGVGRGPGFAVRPEVRCDQVHWIDPTAPTPWQRRFLERMEALRLGLNQRLQLGLFGYEAHLTRYPPGAFYRLHLDVFAQAAHRVLSSCCYLNERWGPGDGGVLRLRGTGGELADILPESGLAVLFLSDRIPHEVLPTARERLGITGWFTRCGEGAP